MRKNNPWHNYRLALLMICLIKTREDVAQVEDLAYWELERDKAMLELGIARIQ